MSHLFGDEDDFPDDSHSNHPNVDDVVEHIHDGDGDVHVDNEEDEEDVLEMEGTTMNTQVGALLMRFCPHDSSMLYPQVRIFIYVTDIVVSVRRFPENNIALFPTQFVHFAFHLSNPNYFYVNNEPHIPQQKQHEHTKNQNPIHETKRKINVIVPYDTRVAYVVMWKTR